ncbi:MAG TPA: phenylalanine--tRNA ligase beta subunit-related protein [Candidatus Acidoferrales bacterium]|nr:phenylalanine--tRNA ligase beta subunit-related protein [Candidatus Acidoferrales bacterium]
MKLGLLEADSVRVEPAAPGLAEELASIAGRLARQSRVEQVAELEPVRAVRAMFRLWGVDPSKYRPSSEALLRRVAQGKGLYHVLNIVDIANLGSIETGWPYGCYDRDAIEPPVSLRLGGREEKYEGIGRRIWHLDGRPVAADAAGPFGSPISDSTRTMITEAAQSVAVFLYAPATAGEAALELALERLAARLARWAAAAGIVTRIVRGNPGESA